MKYILLFLLVFCIAACSPRLDPLSEIQRQESYLYATKIARIGQEKATAQAAAQATLEAAQTQEAAQAELDLIQGRAGATQAALDAQISAIEAAQAGLRATQAAAIWSNSATATAGALRATSTALSIEIDNTIQSQARQRSTDQLISAAKMAAIIILVIGLAVLLGVAVYYLRKWLDYKITWDDRKSLIYHSPDGTFYFDYRTEDGYPMVILAREADHYRPRMQLPPITGNQVPEVQHITPSVLASPMPTHDTKDPRELALQVVEASIGHFRTPDANIIPRWSVLNINPKTWELGTDEIERMGLITKQQGKPTITQVKLGELLYRLQHSPAPR